MKKRKNEKMKKMKNRRRKNDGIEKCKSREGRKVRNECSELKS